MRPQNGRWMVSLMVSVAVFASAAQQALAGTWYERGPAVGGRLSAIVASPSAPNTLLVASPGGGVWRTTNNGTSWAVPANYALGDFSIVHMEWDRFHSGRLYASTYSDLLATTDLGDHWQNLTNNGGKPAPLMPPTPHVADPHPFAQLAYTSSSGTVFWAKPCSGIYYSNDGTTFTQMWPFSGGSSNLDNCVSAIAADGATKRVYIVTLADTLSAVTAPHVFQSNCAWSAATPCTGFVAASTGLPAPGRTDAITWAGTSGRLAATVYSGGTYKTYATTNGGASWTGMAGQISGSFWDVRSLVNPGGGNQLILGGSLPYMTLDFGATSWTQLPLPSGTHPDFRAFHWSGGYLWAVDDGAMSGGYANIVRWSFTPGSAPNSPVPIPVAGIKAWQPFYNAVTGQVGQTRRRMLIGAIDNGALCSDNGGVSWTTSGAAPGGGCGDLVSLVIAPSNPNRAYSISCAPDMFYRTDALFTAATCGDLASQWTSVSPSGGVYASNVVWTRALMAVHPTLPNTIAVARSNGTVGVSTTAGASLSTHSLPGGARPVSVFYDNAGALYAGTLDHGIYKSTDGGSTWLAFGLSSPAPKLVMNMAWTSAGGGAGTYFAATTNGLYRLLPGSTWTLVTAGQGYTVNDVEVDRHCPTRIYAALGFIATLGSHRGGVRMSSDNGSTWTSITSGLDIHQAPVSDI